MAPPQNSTLIEHSDDESLTPSNNVNVLVGNYSPILRPHSVGELDNDRIIAAYVDEILIPEGSQKSACSETDDEENNHYFHEDSDENPIDKEEEEPEDEEEIPIWIRNDARYVSGITSVTTCNDVISALISDEISNEKYSNVNTVRHNVDDYVITERWRDVEGELEGDTKILPLWQAWGSAQSEVRFRLKINKKKVKEIDNFDEKIDKKVAKKEKMTLVTRLMRRVLKQGDYIQKHISVLKDKKHQTGHINRYNKNSLNKKIFFENYINNKESNTNLTASTSTSRCSSFGQLHCKCCGNKSLTIRNKCFERIPSKSNKLFITDDLCKGEPKLLENISLEPLDDMFNEGHALEDIVRTDDELLLIIENQEVNVPKGDNDSGNGSIAYNNKTKSNGSYSTLNKTDTDESSEQEIRVTPKRKHRSLRDYDMLRKHSLNNHKIFESFNMHNISPLSPLPITNNNSDRFDGIRFEIMIKMNEMKQLLIREEMLLTQIQMKCAKYKAENELYNSRALDLHVDEIQKNLDRCAQEIVQNEDELFKTKLEVEQKAKILRELKTVLELHDSEEEQKKAMATVKQRSRNQFQRIRRRMSMENLEFVDNIYEFCDNNKSMVV